MYGESQKKATYKYRANKKELRAYVDEDFKNRIESYCKLYKISQTALIKEALERYMNQKK